jgi:hypothetical protein
MYHDAQSNLGNLEKTIIVFKHNQNISFLPAIVSTSTRMHGEFLRLLFLQAHRETEAHFTAAGMSSQNTNSEALRFKRAAFYNER